MSQKKPLVYIYNFLEDVIDTFRVLDNQLKSTMELEESTYYNQNQLLGTLAEFPKRDKYYFIFYQEINESFIKYACQLLDVRRDSIQVIIPMKSKNKTGSICEYIMQDRKLIQKLNQLPQFDLLAYCISQQFYAMSEMFKKKANAIDFTPCQKYRSTIKRLGTKPGIRELVESLNDPNIFMPKGKIFYKSENFFEQAIAFIVFKLKAKGEGVVVKTEKLYAGRGVIIVKQNEISHLNQALTRQYMLEKMKENYWKQFDIVVQDLVDVDFSFGPPYAEVYLSEQNKVQLVWINAMIMENQKDFIGTETGERVYSTEIINKITYAAETLGQLYYDFGYRGFIAIDFNIDKKGVVYVGQSNVRRSASLFIHNFVKLNHGRNYQKNNYVMTHRVNSQHLGSLKLQDLLSYLQKIGLKYSKTCDRGIVMSSQNCFRYNFIQFFTVSNTREQGIQMGDQIRKIYES